MECRPEIVLLLFAILGAKSIGKSARDGDPVAAVGG
jgi:hypothetical protein